LSELFDVFGDLDTRRVGHANDIDLLCNGRNCDESCAPWVVELGPDQYTNE